MTVDQFLSARGYSRHLIIALKKTENGLTVNGCHVTVIYRLNSGDVLNVLLPEETGSEQITPVSMELSIVYEDGDLFVIDKASNIPIHPSAGNHGNTLANGLAWYCKERGETFVYRVINRLDRDTTGLLIVAKNALSACILSEMMQKRQIHRTYLAAVKGDVRELFDQGNPPGGFCASCGEPGYSFTVSAPIGRTAGSAIKREVSFSQGESAVTHGTFLSYSQEMDASLVRLTLETGRTHQIRVHMAHLGYPLFGDFLYHPDYRYIRRQSLHSQTLSFTHPITKKPLAFTAAVPGDMACFCCGKNQT